MEGQEEHLLTPQQQQFCRLYTTGDTRGNAVQSYIRAFGEDKAGAGAYRSATSAASRLLRLEAVRNYLRDLQAEENEPLRDAQVDDELAFLIRQNADLGSKLGAIREYNKLKGRITDRVDHSGPGAQLQLIFKDMTTKP